MLNEDTAEQFRAALRAHCAVVNGTRDSVRSAVDAAAAEARKNGLSAEQFVIWVKQVWEEIIGEGVLANTSDPGHIRDAVISSAIKAYYVQ